MIGRNGLSSIRYRIACVTLGEIHMFRREFDDARYWLERAIEINPNDANSLGQYGLYLSAVGRADEALVQYDVSARINPLQADWVDWLRGIAFFSARRYDEAIALERALADDRVAKECKSSKLRAAHTALFDCNCPVMCQRNRWRSRCRIFSRADCT